MKNLILFLIFLSTNTFAQYSFQGDGVISPASFITFDFKIEKGNAVSGVYQYKKYKKPIRLIGTFNDDVIELTTPESSEKFLLRLDVGEVGPSKLIGKWMSGEKERDVEIVLNPHPGLCTTILGCNEQALPLIKKALIGRITVTGDTNVCNSLLESRLFYPFLDNRYNFKAHSLGSGDTTISINPGSYLIDINNDGVDERLIEMSMSSGRGNGCTQEYQQQISNDFSSILDNDLNKTLHPNSLNSPEGCRYYSRPFSFKDKTYIENRAAQISQEELGIDSRVFPGIYASFLSDIYLIENNQRKKICHYDYKRN